MCPLGWGTGPREVSDGNSAHLKGCLYIKCFFLTCVAWFGCDPLLQPLALMEPSVSKGALGVVLREAILCQEKTEKSEEVMARVLGTVWATRACVSPFLKL